MGRFSDYRSTLKRFSTIGVEQNEYKESYMQLANFLISLKDTNIDFAKFPTQQYREDAEKCYDMIRTVVTNYSLTLEHELEKVPSDMSKKLDEIVKIIAPAIDAAERMSKEGSNVQDIHTVIMLLGKAAGFAGMYGTICESILENLKTFKEDGLTDLNTDMKKLIDVISMSSSTYEQQKKELQKQIDILKGIAKDKTNGAIGLGVGIGLFLVLGAAAVIATVATGGGAAPALLIIAGVGVPCLIGGVTIGVFGYQAEMAQKQIKEITAVMSAYDVSIAQLDTYGETYGEFIDQIDSIAEAVETIKEEWDKLAEELRELADLVEKSEDSIKVEEWAELVNFLKDMDTLIGELNSEINKICIDETMVSKGNFNFEMTDEEMQKECAGAKQLTLMQYLLTA